MASNLASTNLPTPVIPNPPATLPTKSQLISNFLNLILVYTSLPGYFGVDEDESEMTLAFWYLFQEALWSADIEVPDGDLDDAAQKKAEQDQWRVAKAVYSELVQVLRRKVVWPEKSLLNGWSRGAPYDISFYSNMFAKAFGRPERTVPRVRHPILI